MTHQKIDQIEKRNTKEKIIEAAIDLFSENGFSAVSIRDITKKVGINESSLYNHFKNKAQILDTIIEKYKNGFGKTMFIDEEIEQKLAGLDNPELFFQHHVISQRERITSSEIKIYKIIYMEQFRNKRIRDFFVEETIPRLATYYEKVFRVMAEKGLIKPIDPMLLADEFNYGLMALTLEYMLLETDDQDISSVARKVFAHIKFICDTIKNNPKEL